MKLDKVTYHIFLAVVCIGIGRTEELAHEQINEPEKFRLDILTSLVRDHHNYDLAADIRSPEINENNETKLINIGDWSLRYNYENLRGFLGVDESFRSGYSLVLHRKTKVGGYIVLLKLGLKDGRWRVDEIFEQPVNLGL